MKAYFLNISEEEKNAIKEKHTKLYDGYVTREGRGTNETPLTVGNYALDEGGITVNNQGDVTEYRNKDINQKLKKTCNECGNLYESETCECMSGKMLESKKECDECGEMYEGDTCECSSKMYTESEIEESIKIKSKASIVSEEIQQSLNWFKRIL